MNKQRIRFMRLMLFFDLPVVTSEERRKYRVFRKFLIEDGFIMLQESVYVKLSTNYKACELEVDRIKKNNPKTGSVKCLIITEKQYAGIIDITGTTSHSQIDSLDRLIIL